LPVMVAWLVWCVLRNRRLSGRMKVKNLAAFALLALVVCGPYFVIAYAFTGNPFFPMFHGIFSSGSFKASANLVADARYKLDSSLLAPMRLPFVLMFENQRFGLTPGAVGIFPLLLQLPVL